MNEDENLPNWCGDIKDMIAYSRSAQRLMRICKYLVSEGIIQNLEREDKSSNEQCRNNLVIGIERVSNKEGFFTNRAKKVPVQRKQTVLQ